MRTHGAHTIFPILLLVALFCPTPLWAEGGAGPWEGGALSKQPPPPYSAIGTAQASPFAAIGALAKETPHPGCEVGGGERSSPYAPRVISRSWQDSGTPGRSECGEPSCLYEKHYLELPAAPDQMTPGQWLQVSSEMDSLVDAFKVNCNAFQSDQACPPGCTKRPETRIIHSISEGIPNKTSGCSGSEAIELEGYSECAYCCEALAAKDLLREALAAVARFRAEKCSDPRCTVQTFLLNPYYSSSKCGGFKCKASVSVDGLLTCTGIADGTGDTWYLILDLVCCVACDAAGDPTPTPTPEASPSAQPS